VIRALPSWRSLWRTTRERTGDEVITRRLIEEASGLEGGALVLALDEPATAVCVLDLDEMLQRYEAGEPLQHILGHWGFRYLELVVSPAVLIPRPETEVVVDLALAELARLGGRRVADLGTGSGAIALSIASETTGVEVFATDSSHAALAVASANLSALGRKVASRVCLFEGDWYRALPTHLAGSFDVIVANPPYIAEGEWSALDDLVRLHDPRQALVAGPSGTEAIEAVVGGAPEWLSSHGSVVVELAPHQASAALTLASAAGLEDATVLPDLTGRQRVLLARR
jgi:release factor glutamine methyltransferase